MLASVIIPRSARTTCSERTGWKMCLICQGTGCTLTRFATVASTDWRWHYQWRLFTRFRWPGSHAIAENSRAVRRASGKTAGPTQKFHVCRHCNLEIRREDVPLLTCCQDPLLSEGAIPPRKEHLRRWKACRAQVSEWLRPAYVWRNRTSANPKHPPEETPFRFRIRQKMSPEAYTATWEAFSITLRGLRGTRELGEARHPGPSGHRRVESACWHICSRLESGIFFIAARAAFSITRRDLRGKRELGEARHPGPSATAFSCSSHVLAPFRFGAAVSFTAPWVAFSITRRGLRGKRELGEARHPGPHSSAPPKPMRIWSVNMQSWYSHSASLLEEATQADVSIILAQELNIGPQSVRGAVTWAATKGWQLVALPNPSDAEGKGGVGVLVRQPLAASTGWTATQREGQILQVELGVLALVWWWFAPTGGPSPRFPCFLISMLALSASLLGPASSVPTGIPRLLTRPLLPFLRVWVSRSSLPGCMREVLSPLTGYGLPSCQCWFS